MMNEPIPISKDTEPKPKLTPEQFMAWESQKHQRRIGWFFTGALSVIVLAFLVPLSVWLTRLALGQ